MHDTFHFTHYYYTCRLCYKPVNVERSNNLWEGEVLCNGTRDTDLINGQVGVRGDDGTSRKVHPLSHQVPTDTPLFGL